MSELSIYDYAKQIKKGTYISFLDVYNVLLQNLECIICKESVADLLGYSNGGFRRKIKVYSTKNFNLPYIECNIVKSLDQIDYKNYHNLKIVPIEKSILEMLQSEDTDDQILIETMANYYYENGNNYSKIKPPPLLAKRFEYYKKEGMMYYDRL